MIYSRSINKWHNNVLKFLLKAILCGVLTVLNLKVIGFLSYNGRKNGFEYPRKRHLNIYCDCNRNESSIGPCNKVFCNGTFSE